jgi:hypothetical protein
LVVSTAYRIPARRASRAHSAGSYRSGSKWST